MIEIRNLRKITPLEAPHRSSMCDLSAIARYQLNAAMFKMLSNQRREIETSTLVLMLSFIRVTDKAVDEHESAREAFTTFVNRGSTTSSFVPLFDAVGHIENCIGSMERAMKFARRMQEMPELEQVVGTPAVLGKLARKNVSVIRNGTEHLDERVVNGKIIQGDLTAIWLDADFLEMEGVRIPYADLGAWLEQLQDVGGRLVTAMFA
jgi:hypothetical protein